MGYRSEVLVLVYPRSGEDSLLKYDQLKTLMNTTFKEVYDYWDDPYFTWEDKHRVLKFACEDVKWYESYPEVASFMHFIDMVDQLDYEFEFVRLGENYEDIETRYSNDCEWYTSVRREVEVPF